MYTSYSTRWYRYIDTFSVGSNSSSRTRLFSKTRCFVTPVFVVYCNNFYHKQTMCTGEGRMHTDSGVSVSRCHYLQTFQPSCAP